MQQIYSCAVSLCVLSEDYMWILLVTHVLVFLIQVQHQGELLPSSVATKRRGFGPNPLWREVQLNERRPLPFDSRSRLAV